MSRRRIRVKQQRLNAEVRRGWTLCPALSALLCIAAFGVGCSDEHAAQDGLSRVESAPPGGTAASEPIVDRARMAREAFDRWAPLVTGGALEEARSLCESWLGTPDHGHHSEAHKCLANVTIATSRSRIDGMSAGAGPAVAPISNEGVEIAFQHYNQALARVPMDLDAHVGRVDLMILAGRYRKANALLDESLAKLASRELLDNWFKLLGRFQRAGAPHEGLAYLQVIEKHHPLDHRVASNLGAFYAMTGNDDQAQAQLERAVTINPDDPYNHWNLARVYDRRDRLEDADRHYQEALAVMNREDARARCDYAEFVATRLEDLDRACGYAKTQCAELYERNCGAGQEHAEQASTPAA